MEERERKREREVFSFSLSPLEVQQMPVFYGPQETLYALRYHGQTDIL